MHCIFSERTHTEEILGHQALLKKFGGSKNETNNFLVYSQHC